MQHTASRTEIVSGLGDENVPCVCFAGFLEHFQGGWIFKLTPTPAAYCRKHTQVGRFVRESWLVRGVFFQVEKGGVKNHLLLARDGLENSQGADNLLNISEEAELVMNAPFSFKTFSFPYLGMLLWIYSASQSVRFQQEIQQCFISPNGNYNIIKSIVSILKSVRVVILAAGTS